MQARFVEEAGAMSVAFVYGTKHIRTPALSGSILPSITRDSILRLARDLGLGVQEERIDISELLRDVEHGEVTEVFCIGTAAVVAPIGRIGFHGRDYTVRCAPDCPVTRRLYQALTDIQYGRAADPYGWHVPLEASTAAAV
jgi:branched-chain amino acid aminotransferase